MKKFFLLFLTICLLLPGCGGGEKLATEPPSPSPPSASSSASSPVSSPVNPPVSSPVSSPAEIPAYSGAAYVPVNGNVPLFEDADLVTDAFETYSPLDSLGRCGTAYANICPEIMPAEERGSIGSVRPTGWHLVKYDVVDGNYLYNRCHLIAYRLAGENANELNLITGTRYLNIEGMSPFEDIVADYVKETGNHVIYRVSPVFTGDNLLADGVRMEAKSVEDNGAGVSFHVFCYNVQPGVVIDYASGESRLAEGNDTASVNPPAAASYILNTNTRKFHYPECASAEKIADHNRQETAWSREECITAGYEPCQNCRP